MKAGTKAEARAKKEAAEREVARQGRLKLHDALREKANTLYMLNHFKKRRVLTNQMRALRAEGI